MARGRQDEVARAKSAGNSVTRSAKGGAMSNERDVKKAVRAAERSARAERAAAEGEKAPNPVWFKPIMFGFMLLGLAWLVVYYISDSHLPVAQLGNWNIAVGIGIMLVGFLMTTRWR